MNHNYCDDDIDLGVQFWDQHCGYAPGVRVQELEQVGRLVRLVQTAVTPVTLSGLTDPWAPEEQEAWLKEAKELVGGCK